VHPCTATCPIASDLVPQPRWFPALSHGLQLRTLPPHQVGLRSYHVPYGSGPHLAAKAGFDATTCPVAPNLTIMLW
jgi:hypothetical protein